CPTGKASAERVRGICAECPSSDLLPVLLGGLQDYALEVGKPNALAALAAVVRIFSVFVRAMRVRRVVRVIVAALAAPELVLQAGHLDGGHRSFESLIAGLQSRAVDGLLQIVAGEHAPGVWNFRLHCRLSYTAGDFLGNVLVIGSLAAQQAAEGNDG